MKAMKRIGAVCIAVLAYGMMFTSASGNTIEDWMRDYPLEAQSVVLETDRDVLDLFNDTRTWLIDNFSNSASKLSSSATSNMITLPIEDVYKTGLSGTGTLEFTLVVEFKDGRMRWSTRDVKLKYVSRNYEFYSTHDTPYGGKYISGYKPFRKEGSELYQKYLVMLAAGMQQVADGDLAGSDW